MSLTLLDSRGGLQLYSYTEYSIDTPKEVKALRGQITDKQGCLVVPTMGYTETSIGVDSAREFIEGCVDTGMRATLAVEGTLIRAYHYDGCWRISTHNRLDAMRSRWSSSETYGEMFHRAIGEFLEEGQTLDAFYDGLDRACVYAFLVRPNPDNKVYWNPILAKHREKVIFVGLWRRDSGAEGAFAYHPATTAGCPEGDGIITRLPLPEVLQVWEPGYDPETVAGDLATALDGINPNHHQGIMLWNGDTHERLKILHPVYARMAEIRGMTPNARLRYLELRHNKEDARIYQEKIFPEMHTLFDQYEQILHYITGMILSAYIARFIKNQYVTLPKDEYIVMKKCHDWFLEDRAEHRICFEKVREVLEGEPPLSLYKMIRRQQNQASIKHHPHHHDRESQRFGQPYRPRDAPRRPPTHHAAVAHPPAADI